MTDETALVTVVIPVYNGGSFLAQAIESALAQTWPHLEVLVVDDGSHDGGETARTCRGYGDRIRYVRQENGGVASALNRGIAEMRGRYFSWLSHDDLYDPRRVEVHMRAILAETEAVITFGDFVAVGEDLSLLEEVETGRGYCDRAPLWAVLEGRINGCTVTLPRHCFERHGMFDEGLPTTQDSELWFRLAQHHRFVHVPGFLVRQRRHAGQGSRTPRHIEESNLLWIEMLERLSPETMRAQGGSELGFLIRAAAFLERTCYAGARAWVRRLIARRAAAVPVGVAVLATSPREALVTMAEMRASGLAVRFAVVDAARSPLDRLPVAAPDFAPGDGIPIIPPTGDLRSDIEAVLGALDADLIAFVPHGAGGDDLRRAFERLVRRPGLDAAPVHPARPDPTPPLAALEGLMIRRDALRRALAACPDRQDALAHTLGLASAMDLAAPAGAQGSR
ncbi:hypothetical protein OPKNFCMD_1250 [Methylobacterium crusticola]|uniref:Glycosyltransferase 2-like domain-containing protein n=1 Tax=Methylobacterium crusticola TaxID=1697972 RepID=A0ABQ4QT89_9HYPH|nr:glycosyltransferase [Methylobacterium crusticola]GJD48528.1 hypothetical protein OPKNFCMD_1250 [Methylobacterium crusticola]